jgi:uncharacterized protein
MLGLTQDNMCESRKLKNRLGVFAKHWTPGQVKTRLAAIGLDNASQVYLQMLTHLLSKLRTFPAQKSIVFAPVENRDAFAELAKNDWSLVAQSSGGLGDRLKEFFIDQFQAGIDQRDFQSRTARLESESDPRGFEVGFRYPSVVVIGSDCPAVDQELIASAFQILEKSPVVVGPSQDGGYYLIGMNQPHWEVFQGIAWSTDRVFAQTIAVLQRCGIKYGLLPMLTDIDTPEDLTRFVQELSQSVCLEPMDQKLLRQLKLLTQLD